ncbi:phosphate regulon sensor histidine kinase PhoR [Accumulibacter sp.]|uniref:phosphate regulon sensor histidine kinase PhoR n=1 Tax=Accumulibacter sp. TaxID=2053492 RepID=UPI0025E17E97|nr:phosphate regulon sensor histidine kinase PhoR [Accumulibacter sp.]MCM8595996.1 phosphate regulon sensor histidine kinase PhoR [Accumulibacter sp.]MCM8626620.1 phosphate regulon sensor histidine kinase PhoR [Accumulibacter sp.]MDS4050146.1 phosphate regulon sensor histidine kinase PhoR [Accumulibacter sp.]
MVCVALAAGVLHGPSWGWAVVALGCVWALIRQTRALRDLTASLDSIAEHPLPEVSGVVGQLVVRLGRRLRHEGRLRSAVEGELRSFRVAMDAIPDGLVVIDGQHQIVWANRAAGAHLGIHLPGDQGTIIEQLVRTPGFAEYLSGSGDQPPFIFQPSAALPRTYSIRMIALGERERLLASADVTEARRVEAMRSAFVANVSHELRTPLTVVHGFLEHLSDHQAMTVEERQHFVRLMSDQTRRMLSLVDDLLTLSRLESDDVPASNETVDMAELLAQLLAEGRGLSEGRHRIEVRCDGPGLRGSLGELHSAFGNLVSNAVRYTPAGGAIQISWLVREGQGIFSVSDSGMGIAAEHLPRITERFYRVDRGRSRETGGTGLGLAIVKHILLRHQADLQIDSQVGTGSTFTARIPSWRLSPARQDQCDRDRAD